MTVTVIHPAGHDAHDVGDTISSKPKPETTRKMGAPPRSHSCVGHTHTHAIRTGGAHDRPASDQNGCLPANEVVPNRIWGVSSSDSGYSRDVIWRDVMVDDDMFRAVH
jgi:hypothetical protein